MATGSTQLIASSSYSGITDQEVYKEALQVAMPGEVLRFDRCFRAEHHFEDCSCCPDRQARARCGAY